MQKILFSSRLPLQLPTVAPRGGTYPANVDEHRPTDREHIEFLIPSSREVKGRTKLIFIIKLDETVFEQSIDQLFTHSVTLPPVTIGSQYILKKKKEILTESLNDRINSATLLTKKKVWTDEEEEREQKKKKEEEEEMYESYE